MGVVRAETEHAQIVREGSGLPRVGVVFVR